ncbi:MAG: hypothetical protein OEW67_06845 [Cyclobacteriaceae bacterium]|nr:hypothetical protein [Cyclobacteriaceae bacterium]
MKKIVYILLLLTFESVAQNNINSLRLWELMSKSGAINIGGHYRELKVSETALINAYDNSFLIAGFKLNTKSSIFHPNFLVLDLNAEYNPGTNKGNYLVSPDHAERLFNNKLNIRASFLEQKPMNISTYFYLNQNYANREYVNSTKTDSKQWGAKYSFRNRVAPINVSYSSGKWEQQEVETGRTIKNKQTNFQSTITKSFFSTDSHDLGFSYSDYFNENPNLTEITNKIEKVYLNNNIVFDANNNYSYRSSISNFHQKGTYSLNRFIVRENISLNLPKRFKFTGNYNFQKNEQGEQQSNQNIVSVALDHQLFASLRTGVFFNNNNTKRNVYDEYNRQGGIKFDYVKKIPKGLLNLSFITTKKQQYLDSEPGELRIFDEVHVLADNEIVLLNRAFVDPSTVIVKDETGTIIYDINFDYVLVEIGDFLEIQRIPGGQIINNTTLNIDYTIILNGSFKFDSDYYYFSSSVSFFKRLIQIYFNTSNQNYSNIEITDVITLNRFNQTTYGGRLEIGIFKAGIEFNNYQSNIIPYSRQKYFFQLNGKIKSKVMFSLNGNFTDMHLTNTDLNQIYSNVTGKVTYRMNNKSQLQLNLGYRKQEGQQIDLDLLTVKSEFTTAYRKLFFKLGFEMYKRIYVRTETLYKGAYFQIERRF